MKQFRSYPIETSYEPKESIEMIYNEKNKDQYKSKQMENQQYQQKSNYDKTKQFRTYQTKSDYSKNVVSYQPYPGMDNKYKQLPPYQLNDDKQYPDKQLNNYKSYPIYESKDWKSQSYVDKKTKQKELLELKDLGDALDLSNLVKHQFDDRNGSKIINWEIKNMPDGKQTIIVL